jgi:ribosomal protein L37AE/L43A
MANEPCCPHCHRVRLFHTGALWMCPRCSLMITKHALAAESDGTGQGDRHGEDGTREDGVTGNVPD